MLLDLLITINIAVALTIVAARRCTRSDALEFSSFPSLLLLTTLFRLALNVSATRLILLHGDAGSRHRRVRHVRRRRQLRRRPGRLPDPDRHPVRGHHERRRARGRGRGALHPRRHARQADGDRRRPERRPDHRRARRARRRDKIQREADFYGAMDGATKFVKGDAIAGIMIVGDQHPRRPRDRRAPAGHAASPTPLQHLHAADDRRRPRRADPGAADLDRDRHHRHPRGDRRRHQPRRTTSRGQLLAPARGRCCIAAGVLGALGLVPGLPKLPFLLIGGRSSARSRFGAARGQQRAGGRAAARSSRPPPAQKALPAAEPETPVTKSLALDPLELEIGYGLIPLVDESEGGELLKRVSLVRRQMAPSSGSCCADPHPRQRPARLARVRRQAQGRRGRARRARRRLPAGDEPGRRRPVA